MNTPIELSELNLSYLQRVSDNEYSAACPKCGGSVHPDGSLPDRFRIWLHSRATGGVAGWCRRCGYWWTPRGELTPEKRQAWIEEREQYELERKRSVDHAIELLQNERAWLKYHEMLGENRKYYYERRINDFFIDYWVLGYNPSKKIHSKNGTLITPTLTIPIFEPETRVVLNIRNRLLNPINPHDKYRPEFAGLPMSLYFTELEEKPKNKALIVEGEFKAMTTYIALDTPGVFVVGTPGKTPNLSIFNALDECEVVYICLDPDAYEIPKWERVSAAHRLVSHFGKRARVIRLPYKIDDMIINGVLEKRELRLLLESARKIGWQKSYGQVGN